MTTEDLCTTVLPKTMRIMSYSGGSIHSIATGFFIKENGTALTVAHAVNPGLRILARLEDGRTYDCEVLNSHPLTDIAMIKVKGVGKVDPLPLANSDTVRRGQQVLHVGNV